MPVSDLGFGGERYEVAPKLAVELADRTGGRLGTVLTVATVTGTARAGADALRGRYPDAVAEAMEGAGRGGRGRRRGGVPFGEIRAISNAVGPRDRDAWQMPERARRRWAGRWRRLARVKIAYSPCPNDTFVFHAWAHGLVDGAPPVEVTFADIDVTNTAAERGEFDVVKVSYAALPWLLDRVRAAAVRRRAGPRLRAAGADPRRRRLAGRRARSRCPSERSTAYLLFRLWAAGQRPARIDVVPFASIMPAVRDGAVRRRAGDPRGALHLPVVRAARARRPRRVVGGATPGCRSRSARSWPGARSTPTALAPGGPGLGRVRLGAPAGVGRLRRRARRRDGARRAAAAHRALRQRVHPRPRRRGLRRGGVPCSTAPTPRG